MPTSSLLPAPITPPDRDWSDPWERPDYYQSITTRRLCAYGVDVLILLLLGGIGWTLAIVLGLASLGLTLPLTAFLLPLLPLAYHSLLIAGPQSATIGMRLFNIRVASLAPSLAGRPSILQAIIQTICFYGSLSFAGPLIMVVALFNPRRRLLHDWLAGTVVINDVVVP